MHVRKILCTPPEPGKFGGSETFGKWEKLAIPSVNISSVPSLNIRASLTVSITHYTNVKTVTKE